MWVAEWERSAKQHDCGHQRHICSDPSKVWYPFRSVCYASMEEAAAQRKYVTLHEERPFHDGTFSNWSSEATPSTPYHLWDGVTVTVAAFDLAPEDEFLTPKPLSFD